MRWLIEIKRLRCAYLRARAALHKIAQSAAGREGVTLAPVPEDTNLDEVWSVDCTPPHGSVVPKFTGQLWVQYREDGGANLEMIAEYAPREAWLAYCYDAVLGRLFASRRCKQLLRDLAARIE